MRIKNDGKLAALLAASEARARGERPQGSGSGWASIRLPKRSTPSQLDLSQGAAPTRILGVDTALRKTGWGIIEINGKTIRAVDCGVIINPPTALLTDCMRHLHNTVHELLRKYAPDCAAIEGGFYCKNARTAIILGTARGAVPGVLAQAGLPVFEYAPRRAKQAVTGKGNATKEQVAAMVSNLLQIRVENLANDSTDALALAITHGLLLANPAVIPDPPI